MSPALPSLLAYIDAETGSQITQTVVTAIAVALLVGGVVWLVVYISRPQCPGCLKRVKKSRTACPRCGQSLAPAPQ